MSLEEKLIAAKKELDALKQKYDQLKTKAAVDLAKVEQAKANAREQVGTDNVDELKAMKARIEAENDQLVTSFLAKVSEVKEIIARIEESSKLAGN